MHSWHEGSIAENLGSSYHATYTEDFALRACQFEEVGEGRSAEE